MLLPKEDERKVLPNGATQLRYITDTEYDVVFEDNEWNVERGAVKQNSKYVVGLFDTCYYKYSEIHRFDNYDEAAEKAVELINKYSDAY